MIKNYPSFIVLVVLLIGCEGKNGQDGAVGPSLTGTIIGRVQYFDTTSNVGLLSGVMVQLEGTNLSALTDSLGVWNISGVKTGTYVISLSKQGYGKLRNTGFQFVGGDEPANGGQLFLYQIPSRYVKSLDTPKIFQNNLTLACKVSVPITNSFNNQAVVIYCGFDSSAALLPVNYFVHTTGTFSLEDNFTFYFDLNVLRQRGLKSGSKLYFVAFVKSDPGYYDVSRQKTIYAAQNATASNIVSIIVP